MKKYIMLVAIFFASTAMAQVASNSTNTNATAAESSAANQGNAQAITFNSVSPSSETIRSAPTVYAPSMFGSFSQANCMVSVSGGVSFIGFGASGGAPVDGLHCDWRLDQQSTQAAAMTLSTFAHSQGIDADVRDQLLDKAARMLAAASDMNCLSSDRQRAVLEKQGLCGDVADVATLDHRFNQPRNYQVDVK